MEMQFKPKQETPKPSMWSQLIKGIVRPPRSNYKANMLGPPVFNLNNEIYTREEKTILHEGKSLYVLKILPSLTNGWLVLYLHGNSSSKVEAISILKYLPPQTGLAAFDFIGCGDNKEADTISLGLREAQQVGTVVTFLEGQGYKIVIWGRSMGAASALLYGRGTMIVADSSYCKFRSLCKQVAQKNSPCYVPNCLISCFFPCVFHKLRNDVETQGNYDVNQLNIVESVAKINPATTIVFISGDEDKLISSQNSRKLYESFKGKSKYLEIFSGGHNTKRPEDVLKRVMELVDIHIHKIDSMASSGAEIDLHFPDGILLPM